MDENNGGYVTTVITSFVMNLDVTILQYWKKKKNAILKCCNLTAVIFRDIENKGP